MKLMKLLKSMNPMKSMGPTKLTNLVISLALVVITILILLITISKKNIIELYSECYPETEKAKAYKSYKSLTKGWCTSDYKIHKKILSKGKGSGLCGNINLAKADTNKSSESDTKGWCAISNELYG